MSRLEVVPEALLVPAAEHDAAAASLAAAAHAVCSVVVPTGRPDGDEQAVLTLQRLAAELQALAQDVARDGAAVRAAAATYTVVDRGAMGR